MKRLIFVIALFAPLQVMAEWRPPSNPDPRAILNEARLDTKAGRYEDALAKHVWFHQHALEHRPSLSGVRLGALEEWYELGKAYPAALTKLKETHDEAVKRLFKDQDDVRQVFHQVSTINEEFDDEDRTVAVFLRLDEELPDVATQVYDLAQPALVKAKKFALCGKYLKPEEFYADILELYELDTEYAEDQELLADKRLQHEIAEHWLLKRAAPLIALLVLNDRKPEAEKIAEDVRNKAKHPNRDEVLDAALDGKFPNLRFE